jgi:hypothetical protein
LHDREVVYSENGAFATTSAKLGELPIGSEARGYSLMLRSNQHVVWSGSAQAHLENGQVLLHMHADFSHAPVGKYHLVVVSKSFRVTAPVVVKSTSPGRTQ